jgi:hypothetical protein
MLLAADHLEADIQYRVETFSIILQGKHFLLILRSYLNSILNSLPSTPYNARFLTKFSTKPNQT